MISVQSFSSSKYPRLLFSYSDLYTFFFFFLIRLFTQQNPCRAQTNENPTAQYLNPGKGYPDTSPRHPHPKPQVENLAAQYPNPGNRNPDMTPRHPHPKPKVKHHLGYQVAAGTTPHMHNPEVTMHSLKMIMMAVVILQPTLPQLKPSSTLIRHVYYSSILRRDN